MWGGDGFIMQKLEGQGRAYIELSGELVTYGLHPGQTMLVHPGHVGMFEGSVQFQVTRIPGVANKMFGGDGYHLVALTGPGQIWLQSMPLSSLAHAIEPYLPVLKRVAAGAVGGRLANMMMRPRRRAWRGASRPQYQLASGLGAQLRGGQTSGQLALGRRPGRRSSQSGASTSLSFGIKGTPGRLVSVCSAVSTTGSSGSEPRDDVLPSARPAPSSRARTGRSRWKHSRRLASAISGGNE